jgi:hypothetical protein
VAVICPQAERLLGRFTEDFERLGQGSRATRVVKFELGSKLPYERFFRSPEFGPGEFSSPRRLQSLKLILRQSIRVAPVPGVQVMAKTGQGDDLIAEIVEHHRCLPQFPAGKRRPSMERIKPSHPDHVVDIELRWITWRIRRAEPKPEGLVGGPEFPVWEERQIDLKRRAE